MTVSLETFKFLPMAVHLVLTINFFISGLSSIFSEAKLLLPLLFMDT